jgi:hypothetical protein
MLFTLFRLFQVMVQALNVSFSVSKVEDSLIFNKFQIVRLKTLMGRLNLELIISDHINTVISEEITKMKKLLVVTLLLNLLSSCGGKSEETPTSFTINIGNIVSGGNLNGGVILKGSSDKGDFFTFASGDPQNIVLSLPNGTWSFEALGWSDPTDGPVTGQNRCGSASGQQLTGKDANVSLGMSIGNCSSSPYADTTSFDQDQNNGTFKTIDLHSCMTTAGPQAIGGGPDCDNDNFDQKMGLSSFVKVSIPSEGSIPLPASDLSSHCLSKDSFPGSFNSPNFSTDLRLPTKAGSGTPFFVELTSFKRSNCPDSDEDSTYIFPHGLGGSAPTLKDTHSFIFSTSNTENRIYWADNYLGSPDSAFRDSGSNAVLPIVHCNGPNPCLNAPATTLRDSVDDSVKDYMWSLFGSSNLVDHNDTTEGLASARLTFGVSSGVILDFDSKTNKGRDSNVRITFSDVGTCGAASPTVTNVGAIDLNVELCTTDGHKGSDVAVAINAFQSKINAQCFSGCGTNLSPGDVSSTVTLSGGTSLSSAKRDDGLIPELKNMLMGPLGGILFQEGLTDLTSVCAQALPHTINRSLIGEGGVTEEISLALLSGEVDMPDHMTEESRSTFDRRIELTLDGVTEFAFEFNCSTELGNGWFRDRHTRGGGVEETEVYYATDSGHQNDLTVELFRFDTTDSRNRREWTLFQKAGSDTIYKLWSLHGDLNPTTSYTRYSAAVDMSANKARVNFFNDSSTNSTISFTSGTDNTKILNACCDPITSSPLGSCTGAPNITAATKGWDFTGESNDFFQGRLGMTSADTHTDFIDALLDTDFTAL